MHHHRPPLHHRLGRLLILVVLTCGFLVFTG